MDSVERKITILQMKLKTAEKVCRGDPEIVRWLEIRVTGYLAAVEYEQIFRVLILYAVYFRSVTDSPDDSVFQHYQSLCHG